MLTFALFLFECGGFSIRFVSVVVVCARSLPFAFVCLFVLRSCVGLHRLLLGSEATIVFVGVLCGEPGGDEQMAHSQIVVVIAFSLIFEMDVALVLHRRLALDCIVCLLPCVLRWFASFVVGQ